MENLALSIGTTIQAKDGYVKINQDRCLSYCDEFGARVLTYYLKNRMTRQGATLEERFREQMNIIAKFLKGEKEVTLIVDSPEEMLEEVLA